MVASALFFWDVQDFHFETGKSFVQFIIYDCLINYIHLK